MLKHKKTFDSLGVDYRNGFSDVITKIADLPKKERDLIKNDIKTFIKENSNRILKGEECLTYQIDLEKISIFDKFKKLFPINKL